jgi:hypothetical protein
MAAAAQSGRNREAVREEIAMAERRLGLITVRAPTDLAPGKLERTEGETDERYAQRKRLVEELMSISDDFEGLAV